MAATVRKLQPHAPPRRPVGVRPAPPERPPFRDNPRLILLGILLLLAALVAMITLADRSTEFYPDFLSEVVLYALSVADLTMLVALAFVLARNVIKLIVERRRALPFARFRAKLVAALLGMTIIPSVLVLIVGSELIRNSANRWFNPPIEEVLSSANEIAGDYFEERSGVVADHARRIAMGLPADRLAAGDLGVVRDAIAPEVTAGRVGMVEVYQVRGEAGRPEVSALVAVEAPTLPRDHERASADRLAARVAAGSTETRALDRLDSGSELVRAAALVRDGAGRPVGVVVVSDPLSGELASHSRRITDAYEAYSQLKVLKRPLEGVYLSFFLMVTLMILVSATWMGLYVAKRITRPVQALAAGAREIGAGHLDHRIEPETADEFGALVDAFNAMAAELAVSRRRIERSRIDLEHKNLEVDERRRYFETILGRIATGVIAVSADGRISAINGAAERLLSLSGSTAGEPVSVALGRDDLSPLRRLVDDQRTAVKDPAPHEISLVSDGREVRLSVAATTLVSDAGSIEGVVVVLDDVTPLIRAQRVAAWRDVARRLAHEIKNPLTPIQLCAERLRRHFSGSPPPTRALVDECTGTIVGEVESLKALVDEFSQFARMPAPRAVPSDLHALLDDALSLYHGLLRSVRIVRTYAAALPPVRVDAEQIRRVVINLVDNAIEALGGPDGTAPGGGPGLITIETQHDLTNGVARVMVADNGPGIPDADREKLFMPYYSTKRRGSGLGLAIVRRIVAEHGGSIEVGDNQPTGTRFTIELPC
jgi:two-component system nitrogen regulation sensor histidine kinase NtrY